MACTAYQMPMWQASYVLIKFYKLNNLSASKLYFLTLQSLQQFFGFKIQVISICFI